MSRAVIALCVSLALVYSTAVGSQESGPISVSPGGADDVLSIGQSCPTFSWGAAPGARSYELMVFDLADLHLRDEEEEAGELAAVVRTTIPGTVHSWTPSLDLCLEAGEEYAWYVMAIDELGERQLSPGRFFAVEDAPSTDEVADALDVLERYLAESGSATTGLAGTIDGAMADRKAATSHKRAARARSEDGSSGAGPDASTAASIATGTAGLRSEVADKTGVTYGVLGISNSNMGAGLAAENTSAFGPDLLLAGPAVSLAMSETGMYVASPSPQTFDIYNSLGAMELRINEAKVFTQENDGPGSGLDADLLDGQQGSSYRNWNNLMNVPAGFVDGVDDVGTGDITGVTAGSGLTGGGASGAVTIAADTDFLQLRVTHACALGESIRVINSNGTVTCEPDDAPRVFRFNGSAGSISENSSVYLFLGPTVDITLTGGQSLVGAAEAALATSSGVAAGRAGLCYRLGPTGTVSNFAGGQYSNVEVDTTRTPVAATAAIASLEPGTYTVGFCFRKMGGNPMTSNDFVNGWVMLID